MKTLNSLVLGTIAGLLFWNHSNAGGIIVDDLAIINRGGSKFLELTTSFAMRAPGETWSYTFNKESSIGTTDYWRLSWNSSSSYSAMYLTIPGQLLDAEFVEDTIPFVTPYFGLPNTNLLELTPGSTTWLAYWDDARYGYLLPGDYFGWIELYYDGTMATILHGATLVESLMDYEGIRVGEYTITAVPEPSSWLLVTMFVPAIAIQYRKRRVRQFG